jgi:hypothetical protein
MEGDRGEDDGMGMDQMVFENNLDAYTSQLDSAEMRDNVPSLMDPVHTNSTNSQGGDKIPSHRESAKSTSSNKKSKSAVLGTNRLRVRSNSNAHNTSASYWAPRASAKTVDNLEEEFNYFYKFIVIGDEITGKTNLLLRIVDGHFLQKPKTTYGVEYLNKTVALPNSNQKVKAQIWDTSGAREFLSITTTHYRFAVGAFLVYDVTNIQSFLNLKDWL